jgi:hypothetical protein
LIENHAQDAARRELDGIQAKTGVREPVDSDLGAHGRKYAIYLISKDGIGTPLLLHILQIVTERFA